MALFSWWIRGIRIQNLLTCLPRNHQTLNLMTVRESESLDIKLSEFWINTGLCGVRDKKSTQVSNLPQIHLGNTALPTSRPHSDRQHEDHLSSEQTLLSNEIWDIQEVSGLGHYTTKLSAKTWAAAMGQESRISPTLQLTIVSFFSKSMTVNYGKVYPTELEVVRSPYMPKKKDCDSIHPSACLDASRISFPKSKQTFLAPKSCIWTGEEEPWKLGKLMVPDTAHTEKHHCGCFH